MRGYNQYQYQFIKKIFGWLCDGFLVLYKLKRRDLLFDSNHYLSTHKNCLLKASSG